MSICSFQLCSSVTISFDFVTMYCLVHPSDTCNLVFVTCPLSLLSSLLCYTLSCRWSIGHLLHCLVLITFHMPIAWFLPLTQCYCISVLQKTHPTNLSANLLLFHCPLLFPCFHSTLASWSLASTTIQCPLKHTTHLLQCTSACSRHAPTMFPLALKFEWFPPQRILVLLCFAINIAYLHAPIVFPLAL